MLCQLNVIFHQSNYVPNEIFNSVREGRIFARHPPLLGIHNF